MSIIPGMTRKYSRGFTLIEMIVATVIIGSAVSGIMLASFQGSLKSADPMINEQANIIAQTYLEEATLKPYNDPDGGETGSCEEGAGNRISFDDVPDYDCINDTAGAEDQFGNSLAGLGSYNVVVNVSTTTIGAPAVSARRIDVTVTHDNFTNINVTVTGYRTSYF